MRARLDWPAPKAPAVESKDGVIYRAHENANVIALVGGAIAVFAASIAVFAGATSFVPANCAKVAGNSTVVPANCARVPANCARVAGAVPTGCGARVAFTLCAAIRKQ